MSARARRTVAIAGGTSGIGLAIAELFLSRRFEVAVGGRSARDPSLPAGMMHCRIDVRRREDLRRFVRAVRTRFGRLDVFVNCAGASGWKALGAIRPEAAQQVLETGVLGTLWGCAAAAEMMGQGGCIVNMSSLAGKRGSANNSLYCASKFAVNGITQALAKELGPRGIRVNAVCPVYVRTGQLIEALRGPDSPANGDDPEAYLKTFAEVQTALGGLPTAREVAEVVYFFASPSASAITGQCLNVDCGTLPQ